MRGYLLDWLSLLLRWMHIIAGIGWIGASFYLVWLQNVRLAPQSLRWFSGQAYGTWLSGLALLILLYFLQAPGTTVAGSVALLIGSWFAYDGLCRSGFAGGSVRLGIALALLGCILAGIVCLLFSGRGAFILFGAVLGTLMVANIFFVIVPGRLQNAEAALAVRAGQRWAHNTYLTLPVLFMMLGSHSARLYSGPYNWLVLVAMSFAGVCIRAWFVARHRPVEQAAFGSLLMLIMGLLALIIIIIGLYPDAAAPV